MHFTYIFLIISIQYVTSASIHAPAVYEHINEGDMLNMEMLRTRTGRHVINNNLYTRKQFNYANAKQQDQLRNRYKKQKEVDSYIQAYRAEQQLSKKLIANSKNVKQEVSSSKDSDFHIAKNSNKINIIQAVAPPVLSNVQASTQFANEVTTELWNPMPTPKQVKAVTTASPNEVGESTIRANVNYKVQEVTEDQEVAASSEKAAVLTARVGRGYVPQASHQYPIVLPQNYLSNTHLLGQNYALNYAQAEKINPQEINSFLFTGPQHIPDPEAENYDHKAGSQIEALRTLLGKDPSIQLREFNALLGNHAELAAQKYHLYYPVEQNAYAQQIKDHTPIVENVPDVVNPSQKPNVQIASSSHDASQINYAVQNLKSSSLQQQYKNIVEEGKHGYGYDDNSHYAAQYEFGYRVRDYHSGNDFGHEESRDGDHTKGHYHVLLPDGRVQNVVYRAGPDGYHATVSYHH